MTELIPYLSGAVTLLFGAAFYLGIQELRDIDDSRSRRDKADRHRG